MIKNIVFDMGNVLIMFYPKKTLEKYLDNEDDIKSVITAFYESGEYRECDRGVKTYEEVINGLSGTLEPRLTSLLKKLYLEQSFGRNEMPPFPEMYGIVKSLKENGYKTYLLSNAGFDFYDYSRFIPAIGIMDGKVVSCDYKLLKPERGIYEAFFDKYSLKPSECIFIDDVEENIEGGRKLGMEGICYSPSFEPIDTLKEKLRAFGVKI